MFYLRNLAARAPKLKVQSFSCSAVGDDIMPHFIFLKHKHNKKGKKFVLVYDNNVFLIAVIKV